MFSLRVQGMNVSEHSVFKSMGVSLCVCLNKTNCCRVFTVILTFLNKFYFLKRSESRVTRVFK